MSQRETKPGIPFFGHDSDMSQDKKIKLLKAKHKLIGYAVFMKLLEEAYRVEGYYLKIDEDFNYLFSDENNLDLNVYILILNDCIKHGLFDKTLYEKYNILTSARMQKNYCIATERRVRVNYIEEYLLISVMERYPKKVKIIIEPLSDIILDEDVDILGENDDISRQSKVKKTKENKNKEVIVSVVDYLNKKLGTKYKPTTDKTESCINARINEGNQFEQFKIVIDKKYDQWFGTDEAKYLRPETLFGNKFEGYLNQLDSKKSPTVEKLSFEKYKEAIQYKKDNQVNGERFKFKEDALNKIIKKYPFIHEDDFNSKSFELTYKDYLKI